MIEYRNRWGHPYYLHEGKSKSGKPTYFFSNKKDGALAEKVPVGFEIYENPDARVFLRRVVPQLVTDEEVAVVKEALAQLKFA